MLFKRFSTLALVASLFIGAEQFRQYWYRAFEETFGESILKRGKGFRKCHYLSSCGHFVQQSVTIWAILVECIRRNICVKVF